MPLTPLSTVALLAAYLMAPPLARLEVEPGAVVIRGSDGAAQLLVTGRKADGQSVDLTHDPAVRFETSDARVVRIEPGGMVRPSGDGEARIIVRWEDREATARVVVEDFADRRLVSFAGEVVPILTKSGCNAGACHGKASGQNGFRLSLIGSDPTQDFESLVREDRGRRVFPSAPGSSLMLRKPTALVPHGGGRRFEPESAESRTIARWIAQGARFDPEAGPTLARLDISPARRRIGPRGRQQLRVIACFDDGSEADVTRLAQFQTNAPDLAVADDRGLVEARDGVGEAAIMARYGGRVAVARVVVPNGGEQPAWDDPRSTNRIDPLLFGKLRELGIPPSPACTDAEFARRSALDLCGILPDPADVVAFESDPDPDKRTRWVDRLLDRPEYADLFAMTWSAILRNTRSLGDLSKPGTFAFHDWIRQAIAENMPYDRFVAALLTAQGDPAYNSPVVWYRHFKTPEEQADDAAQLFLGLRIACARCHHHPADSWGQADYHGFAALFARVGRKPGDDPVTPRIFVLPEGLATDPLTGISFPPRVLGGSALIDLGPRDDPRRRLADWLREPGNPYFARAVVNRYWKHFFGRGLVEPEDDLRASNPSSIPELLDALADDFVAHGYDLKRLVRTIATSRAYDRSSLPTELNARDRRNFARFYPRRLPAEVLFDAIGRVTGSPESFEGVPAGFRAVQLPDEGFSSYFLDVFGRPKRESACACERSDEPSLSQGLHLLNSETIQRHLADDRGRAARWASNPGPDEMKINELYRLAYSRPPTADEQSVCLAHLARRRAEGKLREGFEDLVWTLINTKEFLFNH
jgi:hypothetical protein